MELAEQIAAETPEDRDAIVFSSRILAQAGMPHSDPGDVPHYTATNGGVTLIITPGTRADGNGAVQTVGYPYGMLPRLIMLFFATEVVRTRQREIPLGRSFAEFLRCIGLERDAYYYRAVREQLVRLLSANIRFSFFQQDHLEVMSNRPVADDYALWWDGRQPGQHSLWRSCVVLHDRFYRDVLEHGFPVDLDAIRAIRQSPLKLDLYTWLAYRVHALPKAVRVPWRSLHAQVGSNYADIADFKKRAKRALTAIACVHRGLNFAFVTGGLLLRPSLPPVLPRAPLSFRS
jgi:hypothetical protein